MHKTPIDSKKNRLINSLLSMGTKGYYPLFEHLPRFTFDSTPLSYQDKQQALEILECLNRHRGLERKKTLLLNMPEYKQRLIMQLFFELVAKQVNKENGVIQ